MHQYHLAQFFIILKKTEPILLTSLVFTLTNKDESIELGYERFR